MIFVLVVYDISDEKRLRKVAQIMADYGKRVQKSVFECLLDEKRLQMMITEVEDVIEKKRDTVRIYQICGACQTRIWICGYGTITKDPEIYIF